MEKINQVESESKKIELLQSLRDKIDDFKKAPFSIKAGLALVTVMASLGSNEVNAEEIEQNDDARAKFEQVYNDLSEQFDGYDWSAEHTYIDTGEGDEKIIYDFPDFPQSGSGQFEMSSYSVMAEQMEDDEAKLFVGLTQQFGVDSLEGVEISPDGESFEVQIELNPDSDKDLQIIEAISDKIAYIYGQKLDTEATTGISSDGKQFVESFSQKTTDSISLPIANWAVESISDDEGNVTGYSVTIQPGSIAE